MGTFITGDCHQNFDKIFFFAEKMKLTIEDNIIVLGDMGLCWRHDKKDFNYYVNEWENFEYKCNLYWIDGNHENFKLIKTLPIENNMRKCSEHIHMLIRGQVYNFEGKRCLAIGGADSVDKFRRTEGLSWWKDEQITEEDVTAAVGHKSLDFDYVFSHAAPASIVDDYKIYLCQLQLDEDGVDKTSENRLEDIKNKITFKHWAFGHYHQDIQLDDKFTCCYDTFREII